MAAKKSKQVREQAVVYLDPRDRELLERMAAETSTTTGRLNSRGTISKREADMPVRRSSSVSCTRISCI